MSDKIGTKFIIELSNGKRAERIITAKWVSTQVFEKFEDMTLDPIDTIKSAIVECLHETITKEMLREMLDELAKS